MSLQTSDDSSSEDDDDLLNYHPFASNISGKENRRRQGGGRSEKEICEWSDADEDFDAALARRKASQCDVPSFISSPSQLVWYRRKGRKRDKYNPCVLCDRSEGIGGGFGEHRDEESDVPIQFIEYPKLGERVEVSRRSLIPYHGGMGSVHAGDAGRKGWSKRILELYCKQGDGRDFDGKEKSKSALLAETFFLERILRIAAERDAGSFKNVLAGPNRAHRARHHSTGDEDSCSDDDYEMTAELEVPYTQDLRLSVDSDNEIMTGFRLESSSKEPVRTGDVVEYYSHVYVAGDKRGLRRATVLSVDPDRSPMLVLDNGEFLPPDTQIKRIKTLSGGRLQNHPGIYRSIENFTLCKQLPDNSGIADGLRRETERLGTVIQKNTVRFQEKVEATGFAPMDILNKYKGTNGKAITKNRKQRANSSPREIRESSSGSRMSERRVDESSSSPQPCSSTSDENSVVFTKVTKKTAGESNGREVYCDAHRVNRERRSSSSSYSSSDSDDGSEVEVIGKHQHAANSTHSTPSSHIIESIQLSSQSSSDSHTDDDRIHFPAQRGRPASKCLRKSRSGSKISPKRKSPASPAARTACGKKVDEKGKATVCFSDDSCTSDSSDSSVEERTFRLKQRKIARAVSKEKIRTTRGGQPTRDKSPASIASRAARVSGFSFDSSDNDDFEYPKKNIPVLERSSKQRTPKQRGSGRRGGNSRKQGCGVSPKPEGSISRTPMTKHTALEKLPLETFSITRRK